MAKQAICVFCKVCEKPFSVSMANYGICDPELAIENKEYREKGFRVEIVNDFDGQWCDCPKQAELFAS